MGTHDAKSRTMRGPSESAIELPDILPPARLTASGAAKVALVLFAMVTVAPFAAAIALGVGYARRSYGSPRQRAAGGRRCG